MNIADDANPTAIIPGKSFEGGTTIMQSFLNITRRLIADEGGIQHVEEALLLALIAVAAITVTTNLGNAVEAVFGEAEATLSAAVTP
jgi:Flp pilus assembly pilin Flp